MSATYAEDLISFWRHCDLTEAPFAHPDDWPKLRRYGGKYIDEEPKDLTTFISSPRFGSDKDKQRFHLSLLPIPYSGDLRNADIIILLLNPGFSVGEYYEPLWPGFSNQLKRTLAQELADVEFPFMWLNPEHCWHGGFRWWETKLREVIRTIARRKFNGRYLDALRDVSKRLALIELVPYHSVSFDAHKFIKNLPSAREAKCFAHSALADQQKTIIVMRQATFWGLQSVNNPNLIIYKGSEPRRASLGSESPGGQAILRRYKILDAPVTTDTAAVERPSSPTAGCDGSGRLDRFREE